MRVVPMFAWFDFWVGIYWDRKKRCLYVLPVPMFGLRIDFASERKEKAVIDQLSPNWWRETGKIAGCMCSRCREER